MEIVESTQAQPEVSLSEEQLLEKRKHDARSEIETSLTQATVSPEQQIVPKTPEQEKDALDSRASLRIYQLYLLREQITTFQALLDEQAEKLKTLPPQERIGIEERAMNAFRPQDELFRKDIKIVVAEHTSDPSNQGEVEHLAQVAEKLIAKEIITKGNKNTWNILDEIVGRFSNAKFALKSFGIVSEMSPQEGKTEQENRLKQKEQLEKLLTLAKETVRQ